MFNEFNEYKEYAENILTSNKISLKNVKFNDAGILTKIQFSGLQRIIKIIARRWLFHGTSFNEIKLPEEMNVRMQRVAFAKDKVLSWCINDDFSSPFCLYLKQFIDQKNPNATNATHNETFILSEWQSFVKRHDFDVFSAINEKNENSWYFDALIAEAIEEGPLSNFSYTVCNKTITEQIAIANRYNKKNRIPSCIVDIVAYIKYKSPQENKYRIVISEWGNYFGWANNNNNVKLQESVITVGNTDKQIFIIDSNTGIWKINPEVTDMFSFDYKCHNLGC